MRNARHSMCKRRQKSNHGVYACAKRPLHPQTCANYKTDTMGIEGSDTGDKHSYIHLKPIETQAAETALWVRGGKVVIMRSRLKDECMTDWEIALNHFPAIRIDPPGIDHDNYYSPSSPAGFFLPRKRNGAITNKISQKLMQITIKNDGVQYPYAK